MQDLEKPPHNPRARHVARQTMTVAEQVTRFGYALQRMNDQIARDQRRRRIRIALVVLTVVGALLLGYALKDAPAKIAATILQAQEMPVKW
jgi:hypothetical protein